MSLMCFVHRAAPALCTAFQSPRPLCCLCRNISRFIFLRVLALFRHSRLLSVRLSFLCLQLFALISSSTPSGIYLDELSSTSSCICLDDLSRNARRYSPMHVRVHESCTHSTLPITAASAGSSATSAKFPIAKSTSTRSNASHDQDCRCANTCRTSPPCDTWKPFSFTDTFNTSSCPALVGNGANSSAPQFPITSLIDTEFMTSILSDVFVYR